jgi:hypothetical protein
VAVGTVTHYAVLYGVLPSARILHPCTRWEPLGPVKAAWCWTATWPRAWSARTEKASAWTLMLASEQSFTQWSVSITDTALARALQAVASISLTNGQQQQAPVPECAQAVRGFILGQQQQQQQQQQPVQQVPCSTRGAGASSARACAVTWRVSMHCTCTQVPHACIARVATKEFVGETPATLLNG